MESQAKTLDKRNTLDFDSGEKEEHGVIASLAETEQHNVEETNEMILKS